MRVICTGISGTERVGFLQAVAERARRAGRELRIFDVRDVMFQIAADVGEPVEEETILDMFPRALVLLRAAALEKIAGLVEAGGRDQDWVINTHAVFRWKNTLVSGFDPYYLRRLRPDLYVTVTSGVLTVRDRLRRFPRWEDTTVQELLVWREEEQWATEEMARIHHKQQVLWPRTMSPEALYRLMFEPKVKTAYLSYPMQHAERGAERGLDRFKRRLEELLVVYDPADVNDFAVEQRTATGRLEREPSEGLASRSDGSVELTRALAGRQLAGGSNGAGSAHRTRNGDDTPAAQLGEAGSDAADVVAAEAAEVGREPPVSEIPGAQEPGPEMRRAVLREAQVPDLVGMTGPSPITERELQHIADQIVWRDYKLIAQADMVIVFYDSLVASPGVISEMNYALQMGKRVYGVWLPENEPSPFFTRYCTRCFRSDDELFRYFARYRIAGAERGLTRAGHGARRR